MTNRPRSHRIEDQSRIAFERLLPPEWVYRRLCPDYGIDGAVEIFDDGGRSTGRQFNVQLKATDKPELPRALAVTLSLDKCKYYKTLDAPVLIARFHAPTNRMFVKWFHEFDPYYARKGKKSRTFKLSESDEWSQGTASNLSRDIDIIKCVRSHSLPVPTLFQLHFDEESIDGLSSAEISLNLRKILQTVPGVIALTTDASVSYGKFSLSSAHAVINLAGIQHFTLHFSKPLASGWAKAFLHNDVLIAAALTLDAAGYSDRAAKLIAALAQYSSLTTTPLIAVRMAHCFAKAHRLREALDLCELLIEEPTSRGTAHTLMISCLASSALLSNAELELLRGFLERHAKAEKAAGRATDAAIANYNLANHLRSQRHDRAAFQCYRKAGKLDSNYCERGYFWRELAGVLFGLKRYKTAARLYDCAIQLGERDITRALFADALMFSGQYVRAREQFEAYLTDTENPRAEFVLKAAVLDEMRKILGLDEQRRQRSAASRLAAPDSQLSPHEYMDRLKEALRLDALCGLAWFNLGTCLNQQEMFNEACTAFVWAGLVQRNDVEAWANAFALALRIGNNVLAAGIIRTAHSACGDAFAEQLIRTADAQPGQFPKVKFLNMMSDILALLPQEERPFEVRFVGENGDVQIHTLKGGLA
jgi:tetratricopeptide (TPR) repeat protein